MDIHKLLFDFHKTRNFKYYIEYFKQNNSEIENLVNVIVQKAEYPFSEYSSWLLTHIVQENSSSVSSFRNQLIDVVLEDNNQTVLRNCVKILQFLDFSDYKESELLDRLISFIQKNENKVALQVYSIYCLVDYVKRYPELKDEFISIIELASQEKSAAYKGGVKNFIKKVKRI